MFSGWLIFCCLLCMYSSLLHTAASSSHLIWFASFQFRLFLNEDFLCHFSHFVRVQIQNPLTSSFLFVCHIGPNYCDLEVELWNLAELLDIRCKGFLIMLWIVGCYCCKLSLRCLIQRTGWFEMWHTILAAHVLHKIPLGLTVFRHHSGCRLFSI